MEKEGRFVFSLFYNLSKKPGGRVCIVPRRILESSKQAEDIDTEKVLWMGVKGDTFEELMENFKAGKEEFLTLMKNKLKQRKEAV